MPLAYPKPTKPAPRTRARLKRTALPRSSKRIARRVRPRPMAKGETAKLKRECRRLASWITLARCGYRCECDRQPCRWMATDAAHGLSKGAHPAVEFDTDNLIGLSRRCHDRLRSARMDGRGDMSELMLRRKGAVAWLGVLSRSLRPRPSLLDVVAELRRKSFDVRRAIPPGVSIGGPPIKVKFQRRQGTSR